MSRRYLAYRVLAGFTCQTPVFALFFLSRGLDCSGLMRLVLAFAAAKILCDIPSGIFADRVGRKAAVLVRVALEALSVAALFPGYFLLSSLLGGAAVAFSAGAEQALVYEWCGPAFARVFGRATSWSCVSTAVASLAGGVLAAADFRLVYALRLAALVAAGVVALTFEEPARKAVPTGRVPGPPPFRLARLLAFAGMLGAVQVAALQLQQPLLRQAGVPLGALGALYVAFQGATAAGARLSHRLRSPLAAVGMASVAGLALVAVPLPVAALSAVFLLKLAHGASLPAFGDAMNALAPGAARATSLSFRSLFEGSALLVAAPLIGRTADIVSIQAAFLVAAALAAPSLLLLETSPCDAPAGSSDASPSRA